MALITLLLSVTRMPHPISSALLLVDLMLGPWIDTFSLGERRTSFQILSPRWTMTRTRFWFISGLLTWSLEPWRTVVPSVPLLFAWQERLNPSGEAWTVIGPWLKGVLPSRDVLRTKLARKNGLAGKLIGRSYLFSDLRNVFSLFLPASPLIPRITWVKFGEPLGLWYYVAIVRRLVGPRTWIHLTSVHSERNLYV